VVPKVGGRTLGTKVTTALRRADLRPPVPEVLGRSYARNSGSPQGYWCQRSTNEPATGVVGRPAPVSSTVSRAGAAPGNRSTPEGYL
jgi:hypothetical protein